LSSLLAMETWHSDVSIDTPFTWYPYLLIPVLYRTERLEVTMRSKWLTLSLGAVAGVALIAAACGPAAEPSATATPRPANTPSPGSTPGGSETSVSGIPLDPNAKFGGVLVVATTQEGPTTSPWEEAAGVAPSAVHPQTNSLIQHQTW